MDKGYAARGQMNLVDYRDDDSSYDFEIGGKTDVKTNAKTNTKTNAKTNANRVDYFV